MRATEEPNRQPRPDAPLINGFIPPSEFHRVRFDEVVVGDMLCGDPVWGNSVAVVVTEVEWSNLAGTSADENLVVLHHAGMKFQYFKASHTYRWVPEPATRMQYDRAVAQLRSLV